MEKDKLFQSLKWAAVATIVLMLVAGVTLIKSWDSMKDTSSNSITVTGENKVMISPDIASVSFTINETKYTSKEAQALVSAKMDKVKKALAMLKVEDKDIKTSSYNVYPKYNYEYCVATVYMPCTSKQKLEGYEVSHNIIVKVRDLDNVGKVLESLTVAGINNISGPEFTVDNMDKVRSEARGKAIEDAKAKAKVLADQLDVDLEDLISFSDNNPREYMYMTKELSSSVSSNADNNGVSIPQGQNEITVNVNLTYRIK